MHYSFRRSINIHIPNNEKTKYSQESDYFTSGLETPQASDFLSLLLKYTWNILTSTHRIQDQSSSWYNLVHPYACYIVQQVKVQANRLRCQNGPTGSVGLSFGELKNYQFNQSILDGEMSTSQPTYLIDFV